MDLGGPDGGTRHTDSEQSLTLTFNSVTLYSLTFIALSNNYTMGPTSMYLSLKLNLQCRWAGSGPTSQHQGRNQGMLVGNAACKQSERFTTTNS